MATKDEEYHSVHDGPAIDEAISDILDGRVEGAARRAETAATSAEQSATAAKSSTQAAAQSAIAAKDSAQVAAQNADRAKAASDHPPVPGEEGTWNVYQDGAYQDTGKPWQGPPGAVLELGAGVFGMQVVDGHLIVTVNAQEAIPPLRIDENGHLIYEIN